MIATFGDFLGQATTALSDAASAENLPSSAVIAAAAQLRSLAAALSRCLADPRTFPDPAAAARAGAGLHRVTASLIDATEAGAGLGPGAPHPLPARVKTAVNAVAAGLDLLATHVGTEPDGNAWPRTPWAATLASAPVKTALLAEVTDLARLAGSVCQALADVPAPALPAASRDALRTTASQFPGISPTVQSASEPGSALSYRNVLLAVPSGTQPSRQPPSDGEDLLDLCQAMQVSAERIRRAAWRPRAGGLWPPSPALASWRWSARAAGITGHIAEQVLTGLTSRARELLPEINGLTFTYAAISVGTSWNAWRHAASTGAMLTDAVAWNSPSPLAGDLSDLMIRMGRLAYANPAWTPAARQRAGLRPPAELAPGPAELRAVLAAIHHSADALAHMGTADLAAIRISADAGHILPAFGAPESTMRASELTGIYQIASEAARMAAEALDAQAVITDAPSAVLAAVRSANAEAADPGRAQTRLLAAVREIEPGTIMELCRASFPRRPGPAPAATAPAGPAPGSLTVVRRPRPHLAG